MIRGSEIGRIIGVFTWSDHCDSVSSVLPTDLGILLMDYLDLSQLRPFGLVSTQRANAVDLG